MVYTPLGRRNLISRSTSRDHEGISHADSRWCPRCIVAVLNEGVWMDVEKTSGTCIQVDSLVLRREHVVLSLLCGADTKVLS